jgi:hypothetical protein
MSQNNNSTVHLENDNDPSLKFRYSRGLGDAIAAILHSKAIGWLTKLITGKNKPCTVCSQRATALNTLFPIPFWRMFFQNAEQLVESLSKEMKAAGYKVEITPDKLGLSSSKAKIKVHSEEKEQKPFNPNNSNQDLSNYTLITSGDNFAGEFMIRTQIYKKI